MSAPHDHWLQVARSVPGHLELPTVTTLQARTQALMAEGDPRVRVRRVGASRDGEPIDLISIGQGARSALVVGTPHPNEPIGCLTIEFLIDRLRRDHALREELDVTWHFIKTIEPDGLRLNEGWLDRPFDAEAYLRHFFRPAAREQAEYCFPMDVPGYRFTASTPENLAWQEALRLTQPQLLYSLHNCEYGGAFFVLSRNEPELAAALSRQSALFGMPIETFGESLEGEASFAPGVFAAFDPEAALRMPPDAAGSDGHCYDAGLSSFGYCAPQGTLGLIAEAPHWRPLAVEPRVDAKHAVPAAQAAIEQLAGDVVALLDRHLGGLDLQAWHGAARFRASLAEMRRHVAHSGAAVRAWSAVMPAADVARRRHATLFNLLRPVGMLLRLAQNAHLAAPAASEAESLLTRALRQYGLLDGIAPVPLKDSVGLQVLAGLQAASMLP